MNIVFAGTPEIAAHCLEALLNSEHNIVAVYTQPDRPAGRGKKLTPSPVKVLAEQHNLPVLQPETLKTPDASETLNAFNADVMVVVAYGLILPEALLNIPAHGCVNVHTSLLPKYRGAAPVQHAILNNEKQTGVTIMQLDKGCDTGPILAQAACDISPEDTTASLLEKLTHLGSETLLNTLSALASDEVSPQPQDDSLATHAHKIKKTDACIDWTQAAEKIDCLVRAYLPWPVVYSFIENERIRVLKAKAVSQSSQETPGTILDVTPEHIQVATGKGRINLEMIQFPGKNPMTIRDVLNGHTDLFQAGSCFHDES